MGFRMRDKPHVYGNDCIGCFAAGKTPKYIYVRFSGLIKCSSIFPKDCLTPPNDRLFKLTQKVGYPCIWEYPLDIWRVYFHNGGIPALNSRLTLTDLNNWYYFDDYGPGCPKEGHVYYNDCTCPHPQCCGAGGIATVTWTQQATALLEAINMQRADDLFMEMRPLVDGNLVYKFCRLKDATNVVIELEPD